MQLWAGGSGSIAGFWLRASCALSCARNSRNDEGFRDSSAVLVASTVALSVSVAQLRSVDNATPQLGLEGVMFGPFLNQPGVSSSAVMPADGRLVDCQFLGDFLLT